MEKRKYVPMPKVKEGALLPEIANIMISTGSYIVQVETQTGEPIGWIDVLDLLKNYLDIPQHEGLKARDICRPIEASDHLDIETAGEELSQWIIRDGRVLPYFISPDKSTSGLLLASEIMAELLGLKEQESQRRQAAERAYQELGEQVPLGIALVDSGGNLFYANALAQKVINGIGMVAQDLYELVSTGKSRIIKLNNRHYRISTRRMRMEPTRAPEDYSFLVIFTDVTTEYNLVEQLKSAREEAELALAIMLPDQRIALRLQSIVEYTDTYDPQTGKIKITGVISQGVYRHVINILRLIADTFRQGLMELPGMEKNTLVTVAIFHDLAKVQPELKIGDLVVPQETFEQGYLHAFRGAALAEGIYCLSPEIVEIIRYHHHKEEDLPSSFPHHLLPMYRFFRLVDGLSAAITRRNATVKITVNGSRLSVIENNPVPCYNRSFAFDLYSGKIY